MHVVIIFLSVLFVFRPLAILIHELGHGLTALFLSKGIVRMYVGSYGDSESVLEFKLGRLKTFFKYNPFQWEAGMCIVEDATLTTARRIIVVIMGPLTSLVLSIIFFNLAFMGDRRDLLEFLSFFLMLSTLYDFYVNIKPSKVLLKSDNGSLVPNDGSQLIELFKTIKMEPQYSEGIRYVYTQEYESAVKAFEELINAGHINLQVYRYVIHSYIYLNDYTLAYKYYIELKKHFEITWEDLYHSAYILSKLKLFSECIEECSKALEMNPDNPLILNNRGYAYNNIGLYEKAIEDFDKAILLNPAFSYPYNNRGFSRIKLGLESEGLEDIHRAIEMDAKNAYTHRNLGIYYFDKGEYDKALEKFELTYEMDKGVDLINEYLEMTREKVKAITQ